MVVELNYIPDESRVVTAPCTYFKDMHPARKLKLFQHNRNHARSRECLSSVSKGDRLIVVCCSFRGSWPDELISRNRSECFLDYARFDDSLSFERPDQVFLWSFDSMSIIILLFIRSHQIRKLKLLVPFESILCPLASNNPEILKSQIHLDKPRKEPLNVGVSFLSRTTFQGFDFPSALVRLTAEERKALFLLRNLSYQKGNLSSPVGRVVLLGVLIRRLPQRLDVRIFHERLANQSLFDL